MLVKELYETTLGMGQAYNFKFDRVHRVGTKAAAKVRPIVEKFHYYEQREQVRKLSFNSSEALKSANRGIGAQLPKEVRDVRQPLYPKMKEAKDDGKTIKFAGKKLYINDIEYKPSTGASAADPGAGAQANMEH